MVKDYMKQRANNLRYCVFCGRPVLMASSNEDGKMNNNLEWEVNNSAHYSCYVKHMERLSKK